MFDGAERYGHRFVKLVDSRATEKEFEFDQMLLMPTARGYRALVELAKTEIDPRVMRRLSKVWTESTIENLSFFAMAAAVYGPSVANPPRSIDVGMVLLRTAALCRLRCNRRKGTGGGCMAAVGSSRSSWAEGSRGGHSRRTDFGPRRFGLPSPQRTGLSIASRGSRLQSLSSILPSTPELRLGLS